MLNVLPRANYFSPLVLNINVVAEETKITWCFRINPQNEAAKKGLERLEKQMKVCTVSEPGHQAD